MYKSERIYFAPVEKDSAVLIKSWKNDVALLNELKAYPLFSNADEVLIWIQKNHSDKNQVLLGIYMNDNTLIGITRLMFIDWISRNAELGIYIGDANYRGNGIGKEAVKLLLDYGFNALNLRKIHLKVLTDNQAAVKVYSTLGFEVEGKLIKHCFLDGNLKDLYLMAKFNPKL